MGSPDIEQMMNPMSGNPMTPHGLVNSFTMPGALSGMAGAGGSGMMPPAIAALLGMLTGQGGKGSGLGGMGGGGLIPPIG